MNKQSLKAYENEVENGWKDNDIKRTKETQTPSKPRHDVVQQTDASSPIRHDLIEEAQEKEVEIASPLRSSGYTPTLRI